MYETFTRICWTSPTSRIMFGRSPWIMSVVLIHRSSWSCSPFASSSFAYSAAGGEKLQSALHAYMHVHIWQSPGWIWVHDEWHLSEMKACGTMNYMKRIDTCWCALTSIGTLHVDIGAPIGDISRDHNDVECRRLYQSFCQTIIMSLCLTYQSFVL